MLECWKYWYFILFVYFKPNDTIGIGCINPILRNIQIRKLVETHT